PQRNADHGSKAGEPSPRYRRECIFVSSLRTRDIASTDPSAKFVLPESHLDPFVVPRQAGLSKPMQGMLSSSITLFHGVWSSRCLSLGVGSVHFIRHGWSCRHVHEFGGP